jgi:hypothetical protein
MPRLANVLRAATAVALIGGFACLGIATATADPNSDVNTLAGSLSKGYTVDNCTSQPPPNGVLATIHCGQSPDPNGPAMATYLLFGNTADATGSFKTSIKDMTLTNCGDAQSPTVWGQQQGATAGQVACGTYQGAAEIIWTTDAKNVLSLVRASNADVGALYSWWRTRG